MRLLTFCMHVLYGCFCFSLFSLFCLCSAGERLGPFIAEQVRSKVHALQHALLGALPTKEVVTTNYDELYEMARAAAGLRLCSFVFFVVVVVVVVCLCVFVFVRLLLI